MTELLFFSEEAIVALVFFCGVVMTTGKTDRAVDKKSSVVNEHISSDVT